MLDLNQKTIFLPILKILYKMTGQTNFLNPKSITKDLELLFSDRRVHERPHQNAQGLPL
jgi:hypothetical protein